MDLGRGGLLLRHIHHAVGIPSLLFDLSYAETEGEWRLAGYVFTFTSGAKTKRIFSMKVDSCDLDPPVQDEDFQVPLVEGMRIDRTVMGGNPNAIGPVSTISEEKLTVDGSGRIVPLSRKGAASGYFWWYAGGGMLAALPLGWWFWRRRRRRRSI